MDKELLQIYLEIKEEMLKHPKIINEIRKAIYPLLMGCSPDYDQDMVTLQALACYISQKEGLSEDQLKKKYLDLINTHPELRKKILDLMAKPGVEEKIIEILKSPLGMEVWKEICERPSIARRLMKFIPELYKTE